MPQGHAGSPIRVLCYNIHYGQGTDGKYDIERLATVINRTKPDLVALQEVDVGVKRSGRVHEAQELADLTGMSVRYGPTQHYQGGLLAMRFLRVLKYWMFRSTHCPIPRAARKEPPTPAVRSRWWCDILMGKPSGL